MRVIYSFGSWADANWPLLQISSYIPQSMAKIQSLHKGSKKICKLKCIRVKYFMFFSRLEKNEASDMSEASLI